LTAEITKVSAFNDTQSNIQPYIRDLNVDRFTINFLTPSSAPTQSPTNNYKLGKSISVTTLCLAIVIVIFIGSILFYLYYEAQKEKEVKKKEIEIPLRDATTNP